MKILCCFAIFVLITAGCDGQPFEGEIVYANTYVSKLPGLTDDRLRELLGDKQEYYIKGPRYRSVTNGGLVQVQVYEPRTNRVYNRRPGNDTLYWIDAAANPDVVVSWSIRRNAGMVLGIACNVLELKTNNGSETIYYSPRYALDSVGFKRHRFGNWDILASRCGALPLKTIVENGQFRMESIATEIRPMVLADAFFAIDDRLPVKRGM
jgi:hypothetical protein